MLGWIFTSFEVEDVRAELGSMEIVVAAAEEHDIMLTHSCGALGLNQFPELLNSGYVSELVTATRVKILMWFID